MIAKIHPKTELVSIHDGSSGGRPRRGTRASISTLILLCLTQGSVVRAACDANPRVIPLEARYAGLSYGEWAARWWQWAAETYTASSPMLDPTGANSAIGQSGPVWFLTWGFAPVTVRSSTVPAGKALLFPCSAFDTFLDGGTVETGLENMANPGVEVDGVSVGDVTAYSVVSPSFMFTLPADNLFGWPAGQYGPDVTAGYWILLAPLPAGEHIVHFFWDTLGGVFAGHWDVTYHLTVAHEQ